MEFGRVASDEVRSIDHSLPADGRSVEKVLSGSPSEAGCTFHVGCAKWGRKEWKGHLYPEKAKEAHFLQEYAKHFDCIELNAVFYSIPTREQMEKWIQQIEISGNSDFMFVPRVSRQISHISRLQDCELMMEQFLSAMQGLGKHLGPMLFQLSDNFGPKNFSVLKTFVETLPREHQFFFELRHPEWFSDGFSRNILMELFRANNVGTSVSDTSGRRDCVHMELTTPELFVRFVGHGDENRDSDYARVDEWINRIENLVARGLEKVYFFAHQHDEQDTPLLAGYIIDQLNRRFGAGLRRVDWKA